MRICVFCGSSDGTNPAYLQTAREVGTLLAQRGIGLVYGGGRTGCMGAIADAALAAGGEVIGIIPHMLAGREIAHEGLTELHLVDSMHERKALMAEKADAFLTLPGGFGTLEEIFEIVTWRQLGYHSKRYAIVNVDGYFDPLLAFCDRATSEGFVREIDRAALIAGTDPEALVEMLVRAHEADRQAAT
jgi:uncharacterized protein (TIGR00730 family)